MPWTHPWFPVSDEELACILPGTGPAAGLESPMAGSSELQTLPLGRLVGGAVVGPSIEPGQGRHLAILGETGMGKSSTLIAVARRAASLGGVILLDPLGETARSFRSGLDDGERARLLWVSPDEPTCGINALEGVRSSEPVVADRRLNDLVHALRRVRSGRYADSAFWGPRLEEMLGRSLSVAAALPGGTLEDAHALLANGGRTRQVVPAEAQTEVRALCERIQDRPDDAEGARRLLYEVVRSPVLRRLLCERGPTLHPNALVEPERIAVISGEAATVGESAARYLLAVYLALVWSELLGRATTAKTFVLLDESQWFTHESLAEMLRLARRKNVHVVLATQTVRSLPEEVADAVWTNVSDFVAFRGSPEEAREFARATSGVSVEEILSLPRGHAAVLLGKGSAVHWVRSCGRPSPPEPDDTRPPSGSPPGTPMPTRPSEGGFPLRSAADVLQWLRDRGREVPAGRSLRVDLGELRGRLDPEGRAVREAGSRLGRAGALLSSERVGRSAVWVVDPRRIPAPEAAPGPTASAEASEVPQPS